VPMVSSNKYPRVYVPATLLLVLVYLFAGYYPFHLKTPSGSGQVNGAIALPNRVVQFRAPGIAYTETAPSWLRDAISTSRFEVSLEVRTVDLEQDGPARIFTLSSDRSHRNLSVGQWGPNLSVQIRTPHTSVDGLPPYTVKNALTGPDWHQIDIRIRPGNIEIRVDGDTRVIAAMPDQPLEDWDPDFRIALGNELSGDYPWLGEIRKAVVRVGNRSFDYLASGALHIPERFTLKDYHVLKLVPFVDVPYLWAAVEDWVINLLGFVPFGWLVVMLRRPRPGVSLALLLSAGVSIVIEAGQLSVFSDRFPSTEDIIMNTLGAALGAWVAKRSMYQPQQAGS
jgi:hypothetical protein